MMNPDLSQQPGRARLGRSLALLLIVALVSISRQIASADNLRTYLSKLPPASEIVALDDGRATAFSLKFVSQEWQGSKWRHLVRVYAPKKVLYPDALLTYVTGSGDPGKYGEMLQQVADFSGAFAAAVGSVPNQPLFDGLREDALLAYTFERYRVTGDATWPALLPMVASVVRSHDVLSQEFLRRFGVQQLRFVVTGASKRGWTTWLTGAVDSRVVAIAPAVFDMLNMPAQIDRMRRAYGADSDKIRAYTRLGLTDRLEDPKLVELQQTVDPFHRLANLQRPKLVLLGTNDPYWVVDSFDEYGPRLLGDTTVTVLPNVGHGVLSEKSAQETLGRWFSLIVRGAEVPKLTVRRVGDRESVVESNLPIERAQTWTADSDDHDFRLSSWSEDEVIAPDGCCTLKVPLPLPRYGRRALVLRATVKSAVGSIDISTPVEVLAPLPMSHAAE
jgi:PhoPQ-activated pathogenicity-related protein